MKINKITSSKLKKQIAGVTDKFVNDPGLIVTLLRSSISSQIASWIDLGVAFVLFALIHLYPWLATAIGAICGGIVNCAINYRFTFHAGDVPVKAVVVKYAMIWLGSLLLNVIGTQLLYELIRHFTFLDNMGFTDKGYFAAARLIISFIVSIFWNFLMQKNFVYKPTNFDATAIRWANFFCPRLRVKD